MNSHIVFDPRKISLKEIKKKHKVDAVIDSYREQLEDLFLIRNPRFRFDKNYKNEFEQFIKLHAKGKELADCGRWVLFTWDNSLVHYLEDKLHQEIRTARNKNLITDTEQKKFYNFTVGVAGLSVGSHGALTIAQMGGAKHMKIADLDVVSATNLNRMRFDFKCVGMRKADLIEQSIYQLDPYSKVTVFHDGVTDKNINKFLDGLDILIEELDDIEIKVKLREAARKKGIPVIMATDNGDSVIMDIERYDLDPKYPVFHGALDGFDVSQVHKDPKIMYEAMSRIIDVRLVPTRVLHSVLEVGRTIYSWPQLASAATLSGAVLAYTVRKIANGEKIKSGKIDISLESFLDIDYPKVKKQRIKEAGNFLKKIK